MFEIVNNLTIVVSAWILVPLAFVLFSRKLPREREIEIKFRSRSVDATAASRPLSRNRPDAALVPHRGKQAHRSLSSPRRSDRKDRIDNGVPTGILEHSRNIAGAGMLALYAARIEDLGLGDFVKVDCAACHHHVALLTPEALLAAGLNPEAKVLDLKGRLRCRGCGRKGRAVVSVKWRGRGA